MEILAGKVSLKDRRKINELVEYLNTYIPSGAISIDIINEKTTGTGVTIDGVLIKDGTITTTAPLINSVAPAITATAGGTKAAAFALTEQINVITVCATALDSVLLPAAVVGLQLTVVNLGVATCAIYGAGTNTIDDIATANPFILQPEDVVTFSCYTTAKWQSDSEADGVYDRIYTDTINENTTAAGVTIDGTLLKDGKATLANGTAAAPAVNFTGATTMGFYMSSATELGIAVEGQFVGRVSVLKGVDVNQVSTVRLIKTQGAPVNSNTDPADKAIMASSFIAGLLTATPGGAINYTLPTGTQMDTACAGNVGVDESFDFNIINIGAGGIITFVAETGFTIVGLATVAAATSAAFKVRKTAANTFVLYRLT